MGVMCGVTIFGGEDAILMTEIEVSFLFFSDVSSTMTDH